ncbi:MAG: hypothetical protein GY946_01055 [bacterium]|nr:hypothetical protein [bacterium]
MLHEGTYVYGASDDLIEVEGDFRGEFSCYDEEVILTFSDGTVLTAKYGKPGGLGGVWLIGVLREGTLFDKRVVCEDPGADVYSDVVKLKPGVAWVYAAQEWEIAVAETGGQS